MVRRQRIDTSSGSNQKARGGGADQSGRQWAGCGIARRPVAWLAGAGILLLAGTGLVSAGSNVNEVGAMLVFPVIVGVPGQETLITFTNAGEMYISN